MSHGEQPHTERLPLVALRGLMIFPNASMPLPIKRPRSMASVQEALKGGQRLVCVPQRDPKTPDPNVSELYDKGTIVSILQHSLNPDGSIMLFVRATTLVSVGGACRCFEKDQAICVEEHKVDRVARYVVGDCEGDRRPQRIEGEWHFGDGGVVHRPSGGHGR